MKPGRKMDRGRKDKRCGQSWGKELLNDGLCAVYFPNEITSWGWGALLSKAAFLSKGETVCIFHFYEKYCQ